MPSYSVKRNDGLSNGPGVLPFGTCCSNVRVRQTRSLVGRMIEYCVLHLIRKKLYDANAKAYLDSILAAP